MRASFALLLAGLLAGCASDPPAAPASPAGGAQKATLTYFFSYEPLSLGLLIDGAPFEGEAVLTALDGSMPAQLVFRAGKTPLPLEWLEHHQGKAPKVLLGERELTLPFVGEASPLRCTLSIRDLRSLAPCLSPLPPPEQAPDACDAPGKSAWRAALDEQQASFEACYSAVTDEVAERLQLTPAMFPSACPRLVKLAGPEPSEEVGLRLVPVCLAYFPPAEQPRLERAQLRRELPSALNTARRTNPADVLAIFRRYEALLPAQAEEIRAIALQRFGPKEPQRWRDLRAAVAALRSPVRAFELCDVRADSVTIRSQAAHPPPRRTPHPDTKGPFAGALVLKTPPGDLMAELQRQQRLAQDPFTPSKAELSQLRALAKRLADTESVSVVSKCAPNALWFL